MSERDWGTSEDVAYEEDIELAYADERERELEEEYDARAARKQATPRLNPEAFEQAREAFDRVYRDAYHAGSRHAVRGSDDDAQAHGEATDEALEAFLVTYLEVAR